MLLNAAIRSVCAVLAVVFAKTASASLQYENLDRYFWKAEVPTIRRVRITTNDLGKVVKPVSFTSIYFDADASTGITGDNTIEIDLEYKPEVTTMFIPSGMPIRVSMLSTNQFIMSSGVTNALTDRVVQIRNIGPSHYIATELRTQFPGESIFRVQTQEKQQ